MRKTILYVGLVFLLAAVFCEAREDRDSPKKLWEEHADSAWQWTSTSKEVRLTKSHERRPTFHKNLSVGYKDKKPTVLRYYFYMQAPPKGYDPTTAVAYPFRNDGILAEYNLASKDWKLVWPNALWLEHKDKASRWGYANVLSRSHFGPYYIDNALVRKDGKLVGLVYVFSFGKPKAFQGVPITGAKVIYDLETGKCSSPRLDLAKPLRPKTTPDRPLVDVVANRRMSPSPSEVLRQFAVGDINGDGENDILTITPQFRSIGIFLGDGSGKWAPQQKLAFDTGISAVCVGKRHAYAAIGTGSRAERSIHLLYPSATERNFTTHKLELKGLGNDLYTITHIGSRSICTNSPEAQTLIGISGSGKTLTNTTVVYRTRPGGWERAALSSPCKLSGEVVFADIDGNDEIDFLISGVERGAQRHKGSKPIMGTDFFLQKSGIFTGARSPNHVRNLCVTLGTEKDLVFSLGRDVMKFDIKNGWVKIAEIEGFVLCAEQDMTGVYRDNQVILAKTEKSYALGTFNCQTLKLSTIGTFQIDRSLRPVSMVVPHHGTFSETIVVLYDDQKRTLSCFAPLTIIAQPDAPADAGKPRR
jgi:hypothetical protein